MLRHQYFFSANKMNKAESAIDIYSVNGLRHTVYIRSIRTNWIHHLFYWPIRIYNKGIFGIDSIAFSYDTLFENLLFYCFEKSDNQKNWNLNATIPGAIKSFAWTKENPFNLYFSFYRHSECEYLMSAIHLMTVSLHIKRVR